MHSGLQHQRNERRLTTPEPPLLTDAPMTTYRVTPISTHITREGQHPIFGEGILISLDDEAGGAFLVIKNTGDDGGSIRVELEELEILLIEARKLMAAVEP